MDNSHIASEIKSRLKMPELLRAYGIEVDRHNRIACPLHGGVDKNCGVKDDYIHCFVCGESADQIGFVEKLFSLKFKDAVAKINIDFSLGLPIGEIMSKNQRAEMSRQAFFREQEKKRKEKEHERYLSAWLDAHEELVRLEKQREQYKPKSENEPLNPLFLEALKNIEHAKYKLSCAEEELYSYEQNNR